MKVLKVKKLARKCDYDSIYDLWSVLSRKYSHKFDHIIIYADIWGEKVKLGINWGALGTQTPAQAGKFANNVLAAIQACNEIEKEIKKSFPDAVFVK